MRICSANELGAVLPRLTAILEAHQKAAEQLETDKAALASERAALAAESAALASREKAVAAREESCKAAEVRNDERAQALKRGETELAVSKAAPRANPQKKAAAMDSLSMQVLARATATALLKHGLQKNGQPAAS